jgi:hypothetical protein
LSGQDIMFERYYATGRFAEQGQEEAVLQLRLRGVKAHLDAFCCFIPILLWRILALLRSALFR